MNDRVGEHLWHEWDGELLESESNNVYYTHGHIDTDIEIVKRALASALQRDGIADSLGNAFKMIEYSATTHGWAGSNYGDMSLTACDYSGETHYGDTLDSFEEITFIEFD